MAVRLRFLTARQVFEVFPTAAEDVEAEPDDSGPLAYLKSLLESKTPEAAIGFCAYLLPRREAVWWASQCIRLIEKPITDIDEDLLFKADSWVKEPEEENRRAALNAGMTAKFKSAAAWAALAAGWSGGSMADENLPPVPPPNYLTSKAVRAAVLTALARVATKDRLDYLTASVHSAIKLIDTQET